MDSVSRISSILETTRDLTLEAARDAPFLRKGPQQPLRVAQLKKLLDSRHEREVLEGLRHVVAISQRPPQSDEPPLLFSAVVKNIASPSIPIRKLVYIYLLHYAEAEPDTALLSINTIQKSLSSPDPQLRALALRVMSGIRVPVISQIVSLAIKKGCVDMSPLVRKSAALAIPKCWKLDPTGTSAQLEEYLSSLLGDRQYYVAGAAAIAFMEVCPERIDLLHKHYRSLVRKLVDMDEWGQLATLRMMLSYARKCFPLRTRRVKRESEIDADDSSIDNFYGEHEQTHPHDTQTVEDPTSDPAEYETLPVLDPDLILLLNAAKSLLQSRNSAVIVAVTRLYLYLEPLPTGSTAKRTYLPLTIAPLVSLLRCGPDLLNPALHNIIQVALLEPRSFVRYATHFLLRSTDSPTTQSLKLELLTLVFPYATPHLQSLILREASHFCGGSSSVDASTIGLTHSSSGASSPRLVRDCVRAIGRCAQSSEPGSAVATRCMRLLLGHLGSADGVLVAESLTVIRHLIQADPAAHIGTVIQLAQNLDTLQNPGARASVVWLVGEFAGVGDGDNIAADVLRILAKGFKDEDTQVKLQIVLLAAKVYVHYLNGLSAQRQDDSSTNKDIEASFDNGANSNSAAPNFSSEDDHPIPKLYKHIQLLARYDTSYDLRDRSRLYTSLLSTPSSTQLASLLLLAPKPTPAVPSPSESRKAFMLGSASLVIGADEAGTAGLVGYEPVPDWAEEGKEPDPRLRDVAGEPLSTSYSTHKSAPSASERLEAQAKNIPSSTVTMRDTDPGIATPAPVQEQSLDDWLAEDDEDQGETEEETESDSGDESEEQEQEQDEEGDEADDETDTLVK